MKIIDKVLADEEKIKEIIIENYCPNSFGLEKTLSNFQCNSNCKECWNREVDEYKNN